MNIFIDRSTVNPNSSISITGSKSESNRLLILRAQYPNLSIRNLSNSDDTKVMVNALDSNKELVDIHHAGTAMRFLTAYFASQVNREVTLTGSDRMKERPIEILVSALRDLGADISYMYDGGCPPLKIKGKNLSKDLVALDADVSSQYISALMLIAPKLNNGLEIYLKGKVTSVPYINMTLQLLKSLGIEADFNDNTINIKHKAKLDSQITVTVESDWSSASYYYSICALSKAGTTISLSSYKYNSLQGDSCLATIYKSFGVETSYKNDTIILKKILDFNLDSRIQLNLADSPDIAQTIAVTCLGLGLNCDLKGLHTLKIKETDRLVALKTEIEKLGGQVEITDETFTLKGSSILNESVEIETYNDHRMAMAFAPLGLKTPIYIKDAMVVSKSYPTFWEDLSSIGFNISE